MLGPDRTGKKPWEEKKGCFSSLNAAQVEVKERQFSLLESNHSVTSTLITLRKNKTALSHTQIYICRVERAVAGKTEFISEDESTKLFIQTLAQHVLIYSFLCGNLLFLGS
ncbi:hypothetical protein AMECASPLE_017538 [Ameca splendens]|uniref:Uncharacterized protein n=1 Tax=Ameca splendens TaxID=208324 RepID=A0ABV0Z0F2_9TELE